MKRKVKTDTPPNERVTYSPVGYSPREAAVIAGISFNLLYQLWRKGEGPKFVKIGARRLVTRTSIEEWLRSLEVAA
jgi:predicted DNA-binding transcriptional regulator AlpA